MHEMSITQGIIDLSIEHAGGRRVLAVDVEIGELSSVVLEACSQGTLLEGARISIRRIPGRGHCTDCGADMPLSSLFDACPSCGEYRVIVIEGEEMRVREIEVED